MDQHEITTTGRDGKPGLTIAVYGNDEKEVQDFVWSIVTGNFKIERIAEVRTEVQPKPIHTVPKRREQG